MSRAQILPFASGQENPLDPGPTAIIPIPSRLENALRILDDLLHQMHLARQTGQDLTSSPTFCRDLELAPTRSATSATTCAPFWAHDQRNSRGGQNRSDHLPVKGGAIPSSPSCNSIL